MTVVVTHTTPADSTFSSTGAAAWNADHALSGVGTMAEQNANNVAITGGTINNTTIGATTPSTGVFTTLTAQNETLKGTGQNLIFQSQTYTHSSWFQSTVTRLDNQTTAPDGSSTAGTITSTNTVYGGLLRQTPVLTATTYTISAYVKKNNWSYVGLRIGSLSGAADRYAYFNFDTLATSTNGISGATFTATSVGSGWYRIALSGLVTASAGGAADVAVVASDGSSATNNGAGQIVYVWGVQLELGSVANTYIPTTTSQIYGTPTLSFSGVASIGLQSDGSLYETSAGTGNVRFYTNNIGQEQARVSHTASAVNYHQLTGSATGSGPIHSVAGSDTNIDLNLTPKGTGQTKATNSTSSIMSSVGQSGYGSFLAQGSTGNAAYYFGYSGSSEVGRITMTGNTDFGTSSSALLQLRVANTNSAVNYVQVTGGTTGSVNGATISSQGSDADVNLRVVPKGAGYLYVRQDSTASTGILLQNRSSTGSPEMGIRFITGGFDLSDSRYAEISSTGGGSNTLIFKTGNGTSPQEFLRIAANGDMTLGGSNTAPNFKIVRNGSAINFLQVTGAATGFGPLLSAQGSDTNIPLVLQPKGTGALQAQQTDSTATGGNARGANAVDWQTNRGTAGQVASGQFSVVGGGYGNAAVSSYAAAVLSGYGNSTSGSYGVIAGGQNNSMSSGTIPTYSSIVGGYSNVANGYYNVIVGGVSNSGTSISAVTTQSGTMNGTTAVTLSGSNASIKVGQTVTGTSIATYTYVAAISGTSLTLSQAASGSSTSTLSFYTPHGVVVGGGNNTATGSYSFIGGGGDAGTAANRNVASGDWSFVGGGRANQATGVASVISGGGSTSSGGAAGNTASGELSFLGGGRSNVASGRESCLIGGVGNVANGAVSTVLGGRLATARGITGNIVASASESPIGGTGVSQFGILILGKQTTDATASVLTSDGGAGTTTNQVILPNNSAYYFRGEVVSGVTGGGNTKGWFIEGVIKRGANAASTALVGTPTVTSLYADAGAATWTIAVTADTTNGGLAVTFTGQASTTIRTVAQIRTTEMTY